MKNVVFQRSLSRKRKGSPLKQKKIFANHILEKSDIQKYIKTLCNSTAERYIVVEKKMTRKLSGHFCKEDTQMAKHTKR